MLLYFVWTLPNLVIANLLSVISITTRVSSFEPQVSRTNSMLMGLFQFTLERLRITTRVYTSLPHIVQFGEIDSLAVHQKLLQDAPKRSPLLHRLEKSGYRGFHECTAIKG